MMVGILACYFRKFCRCRRRHSADEEEAHASDHSAGNQGNGSLEVIGVPPHVTHSNTSNRSHAGRKSMSQPPRGARHSGATGIGMSMSMSSGGGGGGGGMSHH